MTSQRQHGGVGLRIIAVGKLAKVVVLLAVGIASLAIGDNPPAELHHWADLLQLDPGNRFVHRAIAAVSGISAHRLHELGVGTFVYAALFATEGIGLWLRKRWAEYLTIVITISFVPLEIYELWHKPAPGKAVMLVLNVLAVAYLIVRVYRERSGHRASLPATALN